MPKAAEPWSLTSLREKLIKIGAKVVSHGRYVTFQLGRGRAAPARMRSQRHKMRQRQQRQCASMQFEQPRSPQRGQLAALNAICGRRPLLPIAQVVQKGDPNLEPAGNLAKVA